MTTCTLTAALSRGGAVLLLDGDYSLSGSVQLVNGVRLAGMGYGATRLLATTSAPMLTKNSVWYRAQLADLTLDGSDLAVGLSCNLLACTVERVNFTRSPGVGLVGLDGERGAGGGLSVRQWCAWRGDRRRGRRDAA
jgi:hypothetical protein